MRTDSLFSFLSVTAALLGTFLPAGAAVEAVISVKDQRLAVIQDGAVVAKYPVSTSKFGVGDSHRSYCTPLGHMKICEKIGGELASGAVIKGRHSTGEVLAVNAPGRDPIVTRILWLDGCESQNANARGRGIYIHGTPEESRIGKPASYGCIRMRSKDVIALYDSLSVGATVTVIQEGLPRYPKFVAPPPTAEPKASATLIAKKEPAPANPLPPIAAKTSPPALMHPAAQPKVAAHVSNGSPAQTIAAVESAPVKTVAHVSTKPGIAQASFKTGPQFVASASHGAGTDFTQAMRSSILHSGLEDRSSNSEIPQLNR